MERREIIERLLKKTQLHIAEGEELILQQRELVNELEGDGYALAAFDAGKILQTFLETQEELVKARDRMQQQLEKLADRSTGRLHGGCAQDET
jgi:hypothetical protein